MALESGFLTSSIPESPWSIPPKALGLPTLNMWPRNENKVRHAIAECVGGPKILAGNEEITPWWDG
jgi:hypothetical protein